MSFNRCIWVPHFVIIKVYCKIVHKY